MPCFSYHIFYLVVFTVSWRGRDSLCSGHRPGSHGHSKSGLQDLGGRAAFKYYNLHDLSIEQVCVRIYHFEVHCRFRRLCCDKSFVSFLTCGSSFAVLMCSKVTAKMKKTHFDLLHTIKIELQMLGLPQDQMSPLLDHESTFEKEKGPWFNNADNYKKATNLALQAKLEVCSSTLKVGGDAPPKSRAAAADILFSPGDSGALSFGTQVLLSDARALEQYRGRLQDIAAAPAGVQDLQLLF